MSGFVLKIYGHVQLPGLLLAAIMRLCAILWTSSSF